MDKITKAVLQRLDLQPLRQFTPKSSYVDQGPLLLGEIYGLRGLKSFLTLPMLLWWAGFTLAYENAHAVGTTAYTATEVGTLPAGSTRVVRGANDSGEIVGTVQLDHGQRGFFLDASGVQEITQLPAGSDYSAAYDINDGGQVVGAMATITGIIAFRSNRSKELVALNALSGDTSSAALAISTPGKAAGWSSGASGVRAVTWSTAGDIQALSMLPNTVSCRGLAINDPGDVVGVCDTTSGPHTVLWENSKSTVQDLGTLPGSFESAGLSINNKGDIVGYSGNIAGEHYAVYWPKGDAIQNLGTLPNQTSSQALAINNRNEVVGVSLESNGGGERAFVWTEQEGMQDLNNLLTSNSGFVLTHAVAITTAGAIVALGHDEITHSTDQTHESHDLPLRIFLLSNTAGGL